METTQQQPIVNDMPLQPNDLTDIITTVPSQKQNKETIMNYEKRRIEI